MNHPRAPGCCPWTAGTQLMTRRLSKTQHPPLLPAAPHRLLDRRMFLDTLWSEDHNIHLTCKVKLFLRGEDILAGLCSFMVPFQGYHEVLTLTSVKIRHLAVMVRVRALGIHYVKVLMKMEVCVRVYVVP